MADPRMQTVRQHIKNGRYDVARAMLREINDPIAKIWLEKLEGLKPPSRRQTSINWMIPLLVVGISIGVIVVILVAQYLPQFVEASRTRTLEEYTAAEQQYAQLDHYCTQTMGYGGGELCLDWVDLVVAEYQTQASFCLSQFDMETVEGRQALGLCLAEQGVPGFFGY